MREFYKEDSNYYQVQDDGHIYKYDEQNNKWIDVSNKTLLNPFWTKVSKIDNIPPLTKDNTIPLKEERNKDTIYPYLLSWYYLGEYSDYIYALDKEGKYYTIDQLDGTIYELLKVNEEGSPITPLTALKRIRDIVMPEPLRSYITDSLKTKPKDMNFAFYLSGTNKAYAINDHKELYSCTKYSMTLSNENFDQLPKMYLRPGQVMNNLTTVFAIQLAENRKDALLKDSVPYDALEAYVSPNGVIGGTHLTTKEEYILSWDTGRFQKVANKEGYDRKWSRCTKEKYNEVISIITPYLKDLEQKEADYDPDWDIIESDRRVCIEELDLRWSKTSELYGKHKINDKIYILDKSSPRFVQIANNNLYDSTDKKCRIYRAYDIFASCYKELNNKPTPTQEPTKKREHKTVTLEELDLYIAPSSILFDTVVVGKTKEGELYEISNYNGHIVPSYQEIKEDWTPCSLKRARELQQSYEYPKDLRDYIAYSKAVAIKEGTTVPGDDFRFFLNDYDMAYAIDENNNLFYCAPKSMSYSDRGINLNWEGLDQMQVMRYVKE